MVRRETALDEVEELAYKAVCRMRDELDENPEQPVPALYIKALKDLHAMLRDGLKANPLDEENLEPEELLARLTEMSERVRRRIQRARELEIEGKPLEPIRPPRRLDA